MTIKLEGKPVARVLQDDLARRVQNLKRCGYAPKLKLFRVGARPDDVAYERSIQKLCDILGIMCDVSVLKNTVSQEAFLENLRAANEDGTVHGIMIFRPLPVHFNMEVIARTISPYKDVDGMSPITLSHLMERSSHAFAPCTAKSVVEILKHHRVSLKSADITVVGTSLVVGKPLSLLLNDQGATVTMCHVDTKDVRFFTKRADVVVVATGTPKLFDESYFSKNTVVVDVGVNDDGNGSICGDVDYENVVNRVKAITPILGGVGTVTTTILLQHVVVACEHLQAVFKEEKC